MSLYLPGPPASALCGMLSGVAAVGAEPRPSASRMAVVEDPVEPGASNRLCIRRMARWRRIFARRAGRKRAGNSFAPERRRSWVLRHHRGRSLDVVLDDWTSRGLMAAGGRRCSAGEHLLKEYPQDWAAVILPGCQ